MTRRGHRRAARRQQTQRRQFAAGLPTAVGRIDAGRWTQGTCPAGRLDGWSRDAADDTAFASVYPPGRA